ncbi:serine-threonine rich protein [Ophiostoma piceae UAMH 11346]|uniref:Serine-threonine rich protein n=1 Tax=Ophiostoma piceae (strain UAMH 11346) TaxID=1262450 RepID=S3CA39_OPHP1|nr:serine-threonine rich protein [Ophiostoma piceae UAMH 11346]
MKFSVALSLCLAPVVLAKSVRNSYPARRDSHNSNNDNSKGSSKGSNNGGSNSGSLVAAEAALAAQAGLILGSLSQIIVIWVNGGGGAATTTINSVQTVTQTVTAGGGGGAAATTAAAAAETTVANGAATTVAAGTGTTAASGAGATHTVTVGGPKGLAYEPASIQAAVGDMVVFTFLSQNHTVSQSAFTTPCELLAGGMDSGFQPNVNNTVNPPPQVALQVMVATPLCMSP